MLCVLHFPQARELVERGVIFRGLREPLPLGHPTFPPTYKFDKPEKGTAPYDRLPYDRSEKKRIPAWTDRVFYRGSRPGSTGKQEEKNSGAVGQHLRTRVRWTRSVWMCWLLSMPPDVPTPATALFSRVGWLVAACLTRRCA